MLSETNLSEGGFLNRLILTLGISILSMACAEKSDLPPQQVLQNAPKDISETGYLVLGAEKLQVKKYLESHPEAMVRVNNPKHGLYEFQFINEEELAAAFPKAQVHENAYFSGEASNKSSTDEFEVPSTIEPQDDERLNKFLDSCKSIRKNNSVFAVEVSQPIDRFEVSYLASPGEAVSLKINSAPDFNMLKTLTLVHAPDEAAMNDLYFESSLARFQPPVGGEYLVFILGQDQGLHCSLARKSIYVTANPSFENQTPILESQRTAFDLKPFWHLFSLDSMSANTLSYLSIRTPTNTTAPKESVVAVLDTGVNYNHFSIHENIQVSKSEIPNNGIDDDQNGFVDDVIGYDFASSDPFPFDDHGHGSHIAGLIASPLFGISKNTKVIPVKVLTGLGVDMGSFVGGTIYAVDQGAKVINASFGWNIDHPLFRWAIDYADKNNVLIVVAAGNGDSNGKGINVDRTPIYPCSYPNKNIICVAAIDEKDKLTTYSNYGVNSVDIATYGGTPSRQILSTNRQNLNGKDFVYKAGTSMATPIVVGAAALLMDTNPNLSTSKVKQILLGTTQKISSGKYLSSGGKLDLTAAVSKAKTRPKSKDNILP